jgi:hypothetical protein
MFLRPDQIEDLAALINNPKINLGNEPGTGKTPIICVYQRYLLEHHQVGSVWVMPNRLREKNLAEAMKWGEWGEGEAVIIDGPQSDIPPAAAVYIVGAETFRRIGDNLPAHVRAFQADEWHKMYTTHSSGRTQHLYGWLRARKSQFFTPMTGTTYRGRPCSMYPMINIIEPRYYGTLSAFENEHYLVDPFTLKRTGVTNLDKLGRILAKHSIKRTFESIFGPQEVWWELEEFEMLKEQSRIYKELEESALAELENFYIDGTNPGVGFIRARQLLDHPERFPDPTTGGSYDILKGSVSPKTEAIISHFEDHAASQEPLIVYTTLRAQQALLAEHAERLNLKVGVINGSTSRKESDQIDRAYRAGEITNLIVSAEVADVGFNWQFCGSRECSHVVFASLPYDDNTVIQAYRRVIRGPRSRALRISIPSYFARVEYRLRQILTGKSRDAHAVDPTREILTFGRT